MHSLIIILVVAILVVAVIIVAASYIRIRRLDRAAPPPGHQHHDPDIYTRNLGLALATRNVMLGAVALLVATALFVILMQPLIADATDTPTSPATPAATATQEAAS